MEHQNVLVKREGEIVVLILNRPEVLNALNRQMLTELHSILEKIEADSKVRALILTGSDTKAFCAGADVNELTGLSALQGMEFMHLGQTVFNLLEDMGTPSIAAINGYALGGGCELAMACDLRIAAMNAMFGQPEIRLGNIPGWGGTQRLPRLIGKTKAKELIFTGRVIGAAEADRLGLINKVVPPEELMGVARDIAHELTGMPPVAIRMAKMVIDQGMQSSLAIGLNLESCGVAMCFTTQDQREGVKAFLEKRMPTFHGR